jgi:glycosyltransferase involved in cell wall biosynthesis
MKVLSLIHEYPPVGGGGGVVAAGLNETLADLGDTVTVVTSHMSDLPRHETVRGVEVHRVPCWRRQRHYSTAPELATTLLPTYRAAADLILRDRPDVLHTHFVLPAGLTASLLSRRFGIPYVLTAHGSDVPRYNPDRFALLHVALRSLWRRIVRQAAAVTSPSEYLGRLIRHSMEVPVRVIPNAYSPLESLGRSKRKLVLVVARLLPRKGVQFFIDSLGATASDWQFVIAGDGPCLDDLKRRARTIGARVDFTGFVDRVTLRALYEEARIFVFPSLRENFPMVLLEAMDAGCAVITTDADGCAEVVGDAGIVIAKGDAGRIRASLRSLMQDEAQCDQLAARALQRAQLFRWPTVAASYRDLFGSVIQRQVTPTTVIPAPLSP